MEGTTEAAGHRRPGGRTPTGCYWDPQPGHASGTWRRNGTGEQYDPKAAERARSASHRKAETTREQRRAHMDRLVHEAMQLVHLQAPSDDDDSDSDDSAGSDNEDYSHDIGDCTLAVRRLLDKSRQFRRWQQRGNAGDASWQDFNAAGGPWQRFAQARRDRRRGRRRNHHALRECRLLPCQTAALESSRSRPSLRSKRRLLDRMPCRARTAPLADPLHVFETFTRSRVDWQVATRRAPDARGVSCSSCTASRPSAARSRSRPRGRSRTRAATSRACGMHKGTGGAQGARGWSCGSRHSRCSSSTPRGVRAGCPCASACQRNAAARCVRCAPPPRV